MKKTSVFLSLIMAFILCVVLFKVTPGKTLKADAKSVSNNTQMIAVVGSGEYETKADTVQINFGFKTRADTLLEGQNKIKEAIDKISNDLKKSDENVKLYINYSSSYPVSESGLLFYEFDCGMMIKSNKVDEVDNLANSLIEAGATSIYGTNYSLENKNEAYINALLKAKENADNKVKAIYSSATLKGLKEESCYSCCDYSKSKTIKICAKLKAVYEFENTNNTQTNTTAFEVKGNAKPVVNNQKDNVEQANKIDKNLTENTAKTEENLNKNNENENKNDLEIKQNQTQKNKDLNPNSARENIIEIENSNSNIKEINAQKEEINNNKLSENLDKNETQNAERTELKDNQILSTSTPNTVIDANGNIAKIDEADGEILSFKKDIFSNKNEGENKVVRYTKKKNYM